MLQVYDPTLLVAAIQQPTAMWFQNHMKVNNVRHWPTIAGGVWDVSTTKSKFIQASTFSALQTCTVDSAIRVLIGGLEHVIHEKTISGLVYAHLSSARASAWAGSEETGYQRTSGDGVGVALVQPDGIGGWTWVVTSWGGGPSDTAADSATARAAADAALLGGEPFWVLTP